MGLLMGLQILINGVTKSCKKVHENRGVNV
nr:MAG TPA: hypothetical protein [Caudoviricetes sp.]